MMERAANGVVDNQTRSEWTAIMRAMGADSEESVAPPYDEDVVTTDVSKQSIVTRNRRHRHTRRKIRSLRTRVVVGVRHSSFQL
jgi:hypothetical protein